MTDGEIMKVRPAGVTHSGAGISCIITIASKVREKAGFEYGDKVYMTSPKPGQILMTKFEAPKEEE